MTLSRETLLSLPIPEFEAQPRLVEELERSEATNKVFKLNAGATQENVKHPLNLVMKLNMAVAPQYAERLLITHENSEFAQYRFLPGAGTGNSWVPAEQKTVNVLDEADVSDRVSKSDAA
jgi:hypothetical protein